MKELAEQKPEWDKREGSVLDQLNEGKFPIRHLFRNWRQSGFSVVDNEK
jgi:hypothetical protein